MQKTTRLNRLLAAIVAVFMVVCCLPLNAFADSEMSATVNVIFDNHEEQVGDEQRVTITWDKSDEQSDGSILWSLILDQVESKVPTGYELTREEVGADGQGRYFIRDDDPIGVYVKESEKKIIVNFNNGDGTWTDGTADGNQKQFVLSSATPDAELQVPADIAAPEGKELVNWTNNWDSSVLNAGDTFSYNSIAAIVGTTETVSYIAFTAQYEKLPDTGKTLKINWAIDNVEGASWKQYAGNAHTETIAWSDRGNNFVMPELVVNEGYELAGWVVNGKESNYWSADTKTFGLTGLIVEDKDGGYVSITANVVKKEEANNKTLKINWAIDNVEGASWKQYDGNARTETIAWSDRNNTFVMPELVINDGYELAGWVVSGKESNYWGADTKTFGLTGLIVEDENGGSVAITANIVKKEEAANKTLKIHWAIDNADAASWKLYDGNARTETIAWSDRGNTFVMPELEIKDGYVLNGWSVSGKEANYWGADTKTFGLTGLIVEDEEGGYVSITANVVKKEEVTNKTLKIYWAIDNPEAASWKLYDGNARTETIAWSDRGNTFVMPELNIAEGYELAGWSVSGTQGNYWDANTYNFGLTGLIVEDEEGGYVSITANVVKKESKTLRVTWNIDNPDAANWKLYDGNTRTETFAWADRDNTMVMPELEIADGYMLKGWTVDGQTLEVWKPNLETVCLKDKYVEDEHGAHIFITANIVKKDAGGDNSSSSNNNTTTVSSNNNKTNNTQVVKAAAPADNTAKVMPQTGLTAETPVVFGVMMVAALAGAGAYLFAIRKKLN